METCPNCKVVALIIDEKSSRCPRCDIVVEEFKDWSKTPDGVVLNRKIVKIEGFAHYQKVRLDDELGEKTLFQGVDVWLYFDNGDLENRFCSKEEFNKLSRDLNFREVDK